MASYTEHLQLLKKDPVADGSDTFNIQTMLNDNWDKIDEAVSKKAELGADGKVPPEQLPEMKFDPSGSAAAVQKNLDAHTGNKNNPHAVTAAQVGADPAGSAAAVQSSLSAHTGNRNNPHAVTAAQVGADPAGSAEAVRSALASQIAALTTQMGGKVSIQTGSYKGTDKRTNKIELPVSPKVFCVSGYNISPLIATASGEYGTVYAEGGGTSPRQSSTDVTIEGNTVQIYATTNNVDASYNKDGKTYFWAALY